MKLAPAILLTLGLILGSIVLSSFLAFPVYMIIVPLTALWAANDAFRLRQRHPADLTLMPTKDDIATRQTTKPIVVLVACLAFWPVAFPFYLTARHRLVTSAPAA